MAVKAFDKISKKTNKCVTAQSQIKALSSCDGFVLQFSKSNNIGLSKKSKYICPSLIYSDF